MFLISAVLACLTAADLPPDLAAELAAARSGPPEFVAALLIRLSESPRVRARGAKRELLQEAYQVAKAAQHPTAHISLPPVPASPDATQVLSRTGLQARVIQRMIAVDPVWALRLFDAMEAPTPYRAGCEATLAPSFADYYQTLRDLFRRGGAGFPLLLAQTRSMRTPHALAPLAELIRDGAWTPHQLAELAQAYAESLGSIETGSIEFQLTAGYGLQQRIVELTRRLIKAAIPPRPLIEAWRRYLVHHLPAARCQALPDFGPRLAAAFDESLRHLGHPQPPIEPIPPLAAH